MSSVRLNYIISFESPQEILRKNKIYLKEEMDNVIKEVQTICKKYKMDFPNIEELIEPLKDYENHLLKSYTLKIISQPNHLNWVNNKMEIFNQKAIQIKQFLKLLEFEKKEEFSYDSYKTLLENLPEECKNLKKDITNKHQEIIQNKIQKAKENIKELYNIYKNLSPEFSSLKDKIIEIVNQIVSKKIKNIEDDKDLDELKKIYYEIPSTFAKVKNQIANHLLKHKLKVQQEENHQEIEEDSEKIQQIKEEGETFYHKLKKIDPESAEKIQELFEELQQSDEKIRIFHILKEIKLHYIKEKQNFIESEVFKEDIKTRYKENSIPSIQNEIEKFLNQKIVKKEDYMALTNKITQLEFEYEQKKALEDSKKKLISIIEERLKKLGYSMMDESIPDRLQKGEIVEIQTPFGEDYIVRVKLEDRQISVRFIRYVEDENNLSTYEKEKDIAIAKEWCKTYDQILEFLKQNGIMLEEKYRIDPEQKFYYEKKEISKQRHKQEKREDIFRRDI